ASCRLHASAQSPCDRSRMRHHSLPCTIPASDKWICATCHPDAHLTESGIKSHPLIMSKIPVHRFHAIQHLIDRVGTLHQCPSLGTHTPPKPCIVTELKNPLGKGHSVTRSHHKSRFSVNDHVRN